MQSLGCALYLDTTQRFSPKNAGVMREELLERRKRLRQLITQALSEMVSRTREVRGRIVHW
jgi:hypothetical protein